MKAAMKRPMHNARSSGSLRPGFDCFTRLCLFLLSLDVFAAPIRIAVMNFTVEELSYRSSKAAVDLTGVVQAELAAKPPAGVEFVERAELDRAVAELQLGGVGLADRRDGLRAGYWAKADWAVFGTLLTNRVPGGARKLRLEAVELAQASVFSATNLSVKSLASTHFSPDSGEFTRLAGELGDWLAAEAQLATVRRPSLVVAALPLNGRPAGTENWGGSPSPVPQPIRLLSLDAAAQAMAEADLMLGGFKTGETGPPLPAAFFVWPEQRRTKAAGRYVIWDGRGPPLSVQLTNGISSEGDLGGLLSAIRQERDGLAEQPHLREQLAERLVAQSRTRVDSVASRLHQWELALCLVPTNQTIWEGWLRFRWDNWELEPSSEQFPRGEFNYQRHRYEAWANFLDRFGNPAGSLAPNETARTPAGEFAKVTVAAVDLTHDGDAKSEAGIPEDVGGAVLAEWRRRFVNGLVARLPMLMTQEDVRTNCGILLRPILGDIGEGSDAREARNRLAGFETWWALAPADQRDAFGQWGDVPHVLEEFFAAAGQKHRSAGFIAESKAIQDRWRAAAQAQRDWQATNSMVALPRSHLLDEAGRQHFWTLPGISFRPPVLPHSVKLIEFSAHDQGSLMNSGVKAAGKLWLWMARSEKEPVEGAATLGRPSPLLRHDFFAVTATNSTPKPAQIPFTADSVTALAADGDELWVAHAGGLTVWNVTSGMVRQMRAGDGLPRGGIWKLSVQGPRALAVGDEIAWSTNGGANWRLVPSGRSRDPRQVTLGGGPPPHFYWTFCISGKTWLAEGPGGALYSAEFGQEIGTNTQLVAAHPGGWSLPPLLAAGPDGDFWVTGLHGLHRFAPGPGLREEIHAMPMPGYSRHVSLGLSDFPRWITNSAEKVVAAGLRMAMAGRSQLAGHPVLARLTEPVSAMTVAGGFLWVCSSSYGQEVVACYDSSRRGWVGVIPISHKGVGLHSVGDKLAIIGRSLAGRHSAGVILTVPTPSELAAGPVVPDLIPEVELIARTGSLSPIEQAVVALFTGHPQRVRGLLAGGDADTTGPEAMALLAFACDPSGLNRPAESQQWAELGRRHYPASAFTLAVWMDRCRRAAWQRRASRIEGEATAAALLADYDASADGALDLEELNLLLNCEPHRLRLPAQAVPASEMLPIMLTQFDRDQRVGLSAGELDAMLAGSSTGTNPPKLPGRQTVPVQP